LELKPSPSFWSYRTVRIAAGVGWVVGLAAIIYFGFIRRKKALGEAAQAKPLTLADRLRPLVEGAIVGKLSQQELASLERTLHAFWRKRLGLERADPVEAIEALHSHGEAGPLLEQLEIWLHRPGTAGAVDPARLLAPY